MAVKGAKITALHKLKDAFWLTFITAYCYGRHPFLTVFAIIKRKSLPAPACPNHPIDKFLWRKIFDHDPSTIRMSDKLAAKQIAAELYPDIKVPETLWVGKRFEDIPPDLLAGDAVVKSTHGSGFFHIIRHGKYNRRELISKTRKWLRTDYSRYHGEWNYRGIDRKLFVEEFLKDASGRPVTSESKVNVFGQSALWMYFFHDRLSDNARQSLYDKTGNAFEFEPYLHYPLSVEPPPPSVPEMFKVAEKLAAGRDYVRVDLYEIGGSIYFSEFTFFNVAGKFNLEVIDLFPQINKLWDLRKTWFLTTPHSGWRGAYARWLKSRIDREAARSDA